MASTSLRRVGLIAAAVTALGGIVAISVPRTALVSTGLDGTLVRVLEQRFAPSVVTDWTAVTGLIVLGGSVHRASEAIRLAQRQPHLRIVLSGPGDAEISLFLEAGIHADRIHIDRKPKNTYENALMSRELVPLRRDERWMLVTSAYHMPRAMGAFHGVGFHIEPWPVSHGNSEDAPHIAAHEWIGLLAYWLRGRTLALFPGKFHVPGPREALNASTGLTRYK